MTALYAAGGSDPLWWAADPNHPRLKAAMKKPCEICHAKPGRPCWNTINDAAPLPGRLIHIGRIT